MNKEYDIRFSYSAIAEPITCLFWSNGTFIQWGQEAGYTSAEFFPFRKTAEEILCMDANVVASLKNIKSGHVQYNPYATLFSVLTRKEDPLRPGESLKWYNLAFASPQTSFASLRKLEDIATPFHVVTYPYEMRGLKPYGEYKNSMLQTHPAVFNDTSNADQLIKLVHEGTYKGVVWDTFHALEATASGYAPLQDWHASLAKLLEAHVITEVHVQAGRTAEKYSEVGDMNWLKGMTGESPKYNSQLGQMLNMVKEADPAIPLTIEIGLDGLIHAGLIKKPTFMHDVLPKAQNIHKELIDYVTRV